MVGPVGCSILFGGLGSLAFFRAPHTTSDTRTDKETSLPRACCTSSCYFHGLCKATRLAVRGSMDETQRPGGGAYQAVSVEAPTQTVAVNGNGASAHAEVRSQLCRRVLRTTVAVFSLRCPTSCLSRLPGPCERHSSHPSAGARFAAAR